MDLGYPPILLECQNKKVGDDTRSCFTTRTRELGDEQDGFGSFPSSIRTEKVPPPRIIKQYAPIAKASKTSPAQAFPLPPFCYAFPVVLFLASCIDRTGRKNNRIQTRKKTKKSKKKREQSKKQQNTTQAKKQQRKQASKKADRAIILKYQNKQREKQL